MAGFKDFSVYFSQRSTNPATPPSGHVLVYALNDGSIMALGSDGVPFRLDNALVDQSIADLTTVVGGLTGSIEGQIDTIETDLTNLTARVTTVEGNVATISGNLASEIAARIAGDATLNTFVNTVSGNLSTAIAGEAAARIAADNNLQTQITNLSAAAGDGAAAVEAELHAVSGAIESQITDLSAAIDAEATARAAADTSIENDLNLEISNRLAEDTLLESEILAASGNLTLEITNVATDLATEIADRQAADDAINATMVAVSGAIEADIASEAAARAAADAALSTRVNTVSGNLITEIANRIAGDATVHAYVDTVSGNLSNAIAAVDAELALDMANLAANYYDKSASDARFVHLTGDESIDGNKTFTGDVAANNLTVNGNLHVAGTTTTVDSSNVVVSDNIITLNQGETGNGITLGEAGLTVDRGLAPNANLVFDETTDRWSVSLGDVSANPALSELAYVSEVDALRSDVISTSAYLEGQISALGSSSSADLAAFESSVWGMTGHLQDEIDAEVSRAEAAEGVLQSNIDAEVSRAEAAEADLHAEMVAVSGNIEADIATEAATRLAADNALSARVTTVSANVLAETAARAAADVSMLATVISVSGYLQFEIDGLTSEVATASGNLAGDIAAEAAARAAADSALTAYVNTASGNLAGDIAAEAAARAAADSSEATARQAGDDALHAEMVAVSGNIEADITALSNSLGVIMQGSVTCDTVNNLYTISHTTVQTSAAFPVVSLTVPNSGSALYVQGVVGRTATSFDVVLSGVPETSGYVINWIMNMPGNAYIVGGGNGGGSSGGLFGAATLVVSTTGDDTAGAASPYAAEFATLSAAMAAASSGDTIIVRPGTYIFSTHLTWKNGVSVHAMEGVFFDGPNGDALFYDGGTGANMRLSGLAVLNAGTGGILAESDGGATGWIECREIYAPDTASSGLFTCGGTSPVTWNIKVRDYIVTNKVLIGGGNCRVNGNLVADTISVGDGLLNISVDNTDYVVKARFIQGTSMYLVRTHSANSVKIKVEADDVTCQGLWWSEGGNSNVDFRVTGLITNTGNGAYNLGGGSCYASVTAREMANSGGISFMLNQGGDHYLHGHFLDTVSATYLVRNTGSASTSNIDIMAREVITGDIMVWMQAGGVFGKIEAGNKITAPTIFHDEINVTSKLTFRAPNIIATASGDNGWYTSKSDANSRYYLEAENLVCQVSNGASGGAELHINAKHHITSNAAGGPALDARGSSKTFARWTECSGIAAYGPAVAVENASTELHVLSGRVIGVNDSEAIAIYHSSAKVVLYPGTVLIGNGAAAGSITGKVGATPTVYAYGAIATNMAQDGNTTIAVGSLLVDAAVS